MRKIIAALGISLDGYIARPDGTVDFLFMPKDYSMGPFLKTVDAAVLGRKTYEDGLKMGGSFSGYSMAFYVLSRTLPPGKREGVEFTNETPKKIIERLRQQKGKH